MKYPHIKKTVKTTGNFPIMVGDSVKFLEDVESRSLPWDGKVTMVGYPDKSSVKITVETKNHTIICSYVDLDSTETQHRHAFRTESYDKETGYMTLLPDFGIVGVQSKQGYCTVKPIQYKFTRQPRDQYTIGYEGVSEGKKLVPMQVGDTFKSRAGDAGKEYQVDWIASDGAVVVHRIDGLSVVEEQKRRRKGLFGTYVRPLESLLFRSADRTFWAGVDGFEYAELVTE